MKAPPVALLCDACFEDRTGELAHCEDGCDLPLDHDGVCGPRPTGCAHCGYPVRHGSGAAVTCDVCGSFCCEDHHRRHPAYGTHGPGAATSVSDGQGAQAGSDASALDRIARILRDPEWGVGMLEDIGEIVTGTGRSIANLPGDEPTWGRH
jgi:hypothetical protein